MTAVEFRHGLHQSEIMTFDSLGFQESFRAVRTRHVPRISAMGARVVGSYLGTGPPFAPFGPGGDELVANETFEFEPADAHKKPEAFEKTK